ncbi:hypothetical protein BJV77DRAFT_172058 [Russula vinacea]|nr:hypothetical protein BJV77DRAFT_172058 [Russula vinacea]
MTTSFCLCVGCVSPITILAVRAQCFPKRLAPVFCFISSPPCLSDLGHNITAPPASHANRAPRSFGAVDFFPRQ